MLSYNRKNDVAEGIRHLFSQDYKNIEIIIVDNASTDGTAEMLSEKFSREQINVIALPQNIGVAAYNIGFEKAAGEYIVVLDDDSFPAQNAIPRMVEEFKKNDQLGVVAFNIKNYATLSDQSNLFESSDSSDLSNKTGDYLMAFNGCGAGVRKSLIDRVGGYPEEFFLYWNEQDLAIRILAAGYQIQSFSGITAYHKYSPANRQSLRAPFYYTRNLYWLTWKYFPKLKLIQNTLKLIYCSFYYTLEQKTLIYVRAMLSALLNLKKIKRKPVTKKIIDKLRLTSKLAFIYYK
jgi:GT2 family glycosyltransferase